MPRKASADGGGFNQRWAQGAQSGGEFGRRSGVPKRGDSRQGGCGGWRVFVVT